MNLKTNGKEKKLDIITNRGWAWFKCGLKQGKNEINIKTLKKRAVKGKFKIYLQYFKTEKPIELTFKTKSDIEKNLPIPYPANIFKKTKLIFEKNI